MAPKHLTAAAVLGIVAGTLFGTMPASAGETRAVIELFTSQGCSSCPPADKLLGEYADRVDVLALSFNVDYWDYLGWKDTLASPENTARQRAYRLAFGARQVYTPQAVINGRAHVVGSSRDEIESALTTNAGDLTVPISLTTSDDSIAASIGAATEANPPHATLLLVMYDRAVTVPIGRGENTGRTIAYSNVVRKVRPVAMWKGEAMSVDLPLSEIERAKVERCAVILQVELDNGLPGPILGAAAIEIRK